MSKDTYYFSHDANARQDEKILMLRADYGWEGYGIYWALIEMMFENTETALHHNKTKGISVSYNIDITLLNGVINTCITEGLFVSDGDKFWSESLKRRKSKYKEMKEKKAEAGRKGMAKRWGKQENDNNVITDDNTVITKNNKGNEIKGNEIKLNKTKEVNKIPFADTVFLTQEEYDKLVNDFGKTLIDDYIERLDYWQTENPKKAKKDHNKTIRTWIKKHQQEKQQTQPMTAERKILKIGD
jgi:hypothetical protein